MLHIHQFITQTIPGVADKDVSLLAIFCISWMALTLEGPMAVDGEHHGHSQQEGLAQIDRWRFWDTLALRPESEAVSNTHFAM
jgi:hypothetical protein